jgi:hypothetical protein
MFLNTVIKNLLLFEPTDEIGWRKTEILVTIFLEERSSVFRHSFGEPINNNILYYNIAWAPYSYLCLVLVYEKVRNRFYEILQLESNLMVEIRSMYGQYPPIEQLTWSVNCT